MIQEAIQDLTLETSDLLAGLHRFFFPAGEKAAQRIHRVRITESGHLRVSPSARWIPFAAQQEIDSTCNSFRWEAWLDPGKITCVTVTDAYEKGHGCRVLKLGGGIVRVKKITGPEVDIGELQRYLASLVLCPAMLLNHPSLECHALSPTTLRILDRADSTNASVELEISPQGFPLACHAVRPRLVGKDTIPTPWFATGEDFRECEGLRVPRQLKAGWQLPQGEFIYYQSEIVSFKTIP